LLKIIEALGYKEEQYRTASALELFLTDNPGVVGAIITRGWSENLKKTTDSLK
jgi:hypothetical protein